MLLRPIFVIPAALILFLVAAYLIWTSLLPQGRQINSASSLSTSGQSALVVANTNVAPGQVLTAGDVTLRNEAAAQVPVQALRQLNDAQGHMALAAISAGSPILRSSLSAAAVLGLAPHIPVGDRAYAIAVNESDIAGGFLQVGDHVDLYVTLPGALFGEQNAIGRKSDDQSKSTLLLQGVAVLAVGTKLQTNGTADTSARTVTLALSADALSKIALAARLGTITFAIRNPIDQGTTPTQLATLGTLVGANTPTPSPPRRAAVAQAGGIAVYAGKERSVVHVP